MPIVETIEPPSAARETWAVARAMFVVAGGALCVIAAGRAPAGAPPALQPFQARYSALAPEAQATFRALGEALPELEARRVDERAWPTPAALSAAGLPPFDADDRAWSLRVEGLVAAYVGAPRDVPTGSEADARAPFLVLFTEPAPGAPAEPQAVDETHHRLPDGRMVHVAIWSRPAGPVPTGGALDRPMLSGWIQYLAADPRPEPRS